MGKLTDFYDFPLPISLPICANADEGLCGRPLQVPDCVPSEMRAVCKRFHTFTHGGGEIHDMGVRRGLVSGPQQDTRPFQHRRVGVRYTYRSPAPVSRDRQL